MRSEKLIPTRYPQAGAGTGDAVSAYLNPHYDAHPGNPVYGVCSQEPPYGSDALIPRPAEPFPPAPPTRCEACVSSFLSGHIGKTVRVEFLLANLMTDRVGVLSEVGSNYIVLTTPDGKCRMMCDLYSVRFVTLLEHSPPTDIYPMKCTCRCKNSYGA